MAVRELFFQTMCFLPPPPLAMIIVMIFMIKRAIMVSVMLTMAVLINDRAPHTFV